MYEIYNSDCLDKLKSFDSNVFTACVTDPPYGLSFMNKEWDRGIPGVLYWMEILRVLKPGSFLLAFGGTRTYHRLACAVEDAGFEIRDCLMWLYGSGMPKGLDISKSIDKEAGIERKVIGVDPVRAAKLVNQTEEYETEAGWSMGKRSANITEAGSEQAKLWDGYRTSLKPCWEPILLAMKPIEGTYANNAITHGVAGLAIDKGRIPAESGWQSGWSISGSKASPNRAMSGSNYAREPKPDNTLGRFPSNVLLDETAAEILDEQTGTLTSGKPCGTKKAENKIYGKFGTGIPVTGFGDSGGASRFFYCSKASKKDRTCNGKVSNNQPTVKPFELMRYLCSLVTPPTGGKILDPFMGSGSTGLAAIHTGNSFIGIEKEEEAFNISKERLALLDEER